MVPPSRQGPSANSAREGSILSVGAKLGGCGQQARQKNRSNLPRGGLGKHGAVAKGRGRAGEIS